MRCDNDIQYSPKKLDYKKEWKNNINTLIRHMKCPIPTFTSAFVDK